MNDRASSDDGSWPQPLVTTSGPFSAARLDGAAEGMGDHGPRTRRLVDDGWVPPDLLCGLTLFLLAAQPREPRPDHPSAKASPIAGGVWVRERFTVHRPLPRLDAFTVSGESLGRHVAKGRRYGTTGSATVDGDGRPVATNLTTGLLSYQADPDLADEVEGIAVDDLVAPGPDRAAAADNPHLDTLASATVGEVVTAGPVTITLAMMAARDTTSPSNPIHSDPAAARAAGLDRPIAGGSHVLAFAIEPLLERFGPHVLHHGAAIDARWRIPTRTDETIVPLATVTGRDEAGVTITVDVELEGRGTAMVATIAIPFPGDDRP